MEVYVVLVFLLADTPPECKIGTTILTNCVQACSGITRILKKCQTGLL